MGEIDHARFIALLAERYPKIAASVDDCSAGLLRPEMGTVARATKAAIDAGDEETVRQHFSFIDEVLKAAAPDIENAIYVSYLENLELAGQEAGSTNARDLLPLRLRQALAELEAHWKSIAEAEKPFPTT